MTTTSTDRIPTNTWRRIRSAYQRGDGSCRELAARFGLNAASVSTRCKREGWRSDMTKIDEEVTKAVTKSIAARSISVAQRAERFLNRSTTELEELQDLLQQARDSITVGDLRQIRELIQAWQSLTEQGRRLFHLDRDTPEPLTVVGLKVNLRLEPPSPPEAPVIDVPASSSQDGVRGERGERG